MTLLNWKRGLTVVASVSAMGVFLAGCGVTSNAGIGTGSTAAAGASPVEGGSITLDAIQSVKDLDPAKAYDTASGEFVDQIYDTLVTYKKDTNQIVANGASIYTISSDGKTYTFKIRKGMKFSNGDPVTAQSYLDEFKRVLTKSISSGGEGFLDPIVKGSTAYFKGTAKTVAGLSAPNPDTFVIKLNQPEPFFLQVLAMSFFSAVDQKWIDKVGEPTFDANKPLGSGPFMMKSVSPSQLVMVRNPYYWQKDSSGKKLPYLDQVTVRINTNNNLDALNFEKGETALLANLTQGIPSTQWPQFQTNPKYKSTLFIRPSNATYYLGLNNSVTPFKNVLVRQAVEYAIDKKQIHKLLAGRYAIANQPLPPGVTGYVSHLPADATYSFNIAKAKQLLKKAGYPNGFSTTLYSQNDDEALKIDTAIQSELAQIGIKATIQSSSWATFLASNEKGNVQPMFQLAWIQDFPDASDFLNTLFNTNQQPQNNSSMYSNKQVDAWLNKAQTATNQAERNSLYAKATEQIMKDSPWVPLYYGQFNYAVQPWVHGFYVNPSLMDPLQYIWIDKNH